MLRRLGTDWARQRRRTVWALLDTTSVFQLAHYVRKLPPVVALLCVVAGTVCRNSWRVLQAVFPDRVPYPATAPLIARLQPDARRRHAGVTMSPTGGLTGSGRLTLAYLANELELQRRSGQNAEHFFTFIGQLYMEHCGLPRRPQQGFNNV